LAPLRFDPTGEPVFQIGSIGAPEVTARLEFFFDCSSPWTYLAFVRAARMFQGNSRIDLVWRPVLVGGVFNKVNRSVYVQRANPDPVKARYYQKDLADWAQHTGITITMPAVFPVRSVTAMRACFYAEQHNSLVPFALALFEAYWGRGLDISQDTEIAACAVKVGLDPSALLDAANSPEAKAALIANTDELIERGGFGSPTLFVGSHDMYFGNDRLELVAAALGVPFQGTAP
jgi:2-hydroxychromene-2-carboxylate isomerase